jgi:hypothetical protein
MLIDVKKNGNEQTEQAELPMGVHTRPTDTNTHGDCGALGRPRPTPRPRPPRPRSPATHVSRKSNKTERLFAQKVRRGTNRIASRGGVTFGSKAKGTKWNVTKGQRFSCNQFEYTESVWKNGCFLYTISFDVVRWATSVARRLDRMLYLGGGVVLLMRCTVTACPFTCKFLDFTSGATIFPSQETYCSSSG